MTIHYRNYCEITTGVIKKPKCLRYNELTLESGNKIKPVWRTVKLETGEYSTAEENKPVMLYANTIKKSLKKLQYLVSVILNSFSKTA
jgi:hypothetical protein